MVNEKKKILICGAGSIGIYLGAMLHAKKHLVQLFGRRKLNDIGVGHIVINDEIFDIPEKIFKIPRNEKYDFIFITSKLYDFARVIKLLKKSGTKARIIAAIQNGLVDISKQSRLLGEKIIPIVAFSGFHIEDNKIKVNPTKMGWVTEFSDEGKKIANLLFSAGIPCSSNKNFDSLRAEKTIVNCSLNCLSAIEKKTFKELFEIKRTRKIIEGLFRECYDAMKQEYKLEKSEIIKKRMFKHWKKMEHYSSTYQDLMSGRKTEADFFNGHIIEIAKKYGLATRYNEHVLREMKKAEKNSRK